MTSRPLILLNHPWDRACRLKLVRVNPVFRDSEVLDRGANFFVLALEALGATTRFCCEGHPTGFYVAFESSYELAQEINSAGYFTVEISGPNQWVMRKTLLECQEGQVYSGNEKLATLRAASDRWVDRFGDRLKASSMMASILGGAAYDRSTGLPGAG